MGRASYCDHSVCGTSLFLQGRTVAFISVSFMLKTVADIFWVAKERDFLLEMKE